MLELLKNYICIHHNEVHTGKQWHFNKVQKNSLKRNPSIFKEFLSFYECASDRLSFC